MARKKTAKRMKRGYDWSVSKINLEWDTASVTESGANYADSLYIDGAQCLSIMNRKLVRQGQLFKISNMKIYSDEMDSASGDDFRIKIGVIPTNWVFKNAYVKAKALWNEMNDLATKDLGGRSLLPKWHDFKLFMNNAHRVQWNSGGTPTETITTPVNLDDETYPAGEWIYSQYADSGSTSDEYYAHVLGNHRDSSGNEDDNHTAYTSVGIIKAYGQSRRLPTAVTGDPTIPSDIQLSPWGRLFGDDDQTHEAVENLDTDNDMPPYDYDDYIGDNHNAGMCVYTGRLQERNVPFMGSVPTFFAPLGLIQIEVDAMDTQGTLDKIHISFDITPVEMIA